MSQHQQLLSRFVILFTVAICFCVDGLVPSAGALSSDAAHDLAVTAEALGDSVGYTYRDLQTQQSMPERLVYNPSAKHVQMVWMADTESEDSKSLGGSYFGEIDVSTDKPTVVDLPVGWKRIETRKAGWPSVASFSDGSIGVTAHSPVLFSKNFADARTAFTTIQSTVNGAVFMRSAIDEDDVVHLIFTYSGGANAAQLGYIRSADNGQTWSEPVLLTGATAPGGEIPTLAGNGFDCYALAAAGKKIVVVHADKQQQIRRRISTDNGQTWQESVVIAGPQTERTYHIVEKLSETSARFVSDTLVTPGTQMDVVLDSQGTSYVVFSVVATYIYGQGQLQGEVLTRTGMDTMALDKSKLSVVGLGFVEEGKSTVVPMGPPAGATWDGTGTFLASGNLGASYSCYPQLGVDDKGGVYCVYTSVQNGDSKQIEATVNGVKGSVNALFGHLYATHKVANGTWSKPVNLTPTGVDCLYGTLANIVDDKLYIGYQSDATPGIRTLHQTALEVTVVRFRAFPTEQLNESPIVSVRDIPSAHSVSFALRAFPNPFYGDCSFAFTLPATMPVSLDIYTSLGIKVAEVFHGVLPMGNHTIPFRRDSRAQALAVGQYYGVLRVGSFTQSCVLTVVQ